MGFLSRLRNGDHLHAELGGALGQGSQDALSVPLLVVVMPLVGVPLALGQHRANQPRQLVGGGGDGAWVKSIREHRRRNQAPSADLLMRRAAAARRKACAALEHLCLVGRLWGWIFYSLVGHRTHCPRARLPSQQAVVCVKLRRQISGAPMGTPVEILEAELLQLPKADRIRVLDRVVASLDSDAARDAAWDAVAARRDTEADRDPSMLLDLDDVIARLRAEVQ